MQRKTLKNMTRNIVLVTNEINPYRKSFYDKLYEYCNSVGVKFTVLLMTKVEHGYNWNYEDVKADYAILMRGRNFTFPINNHLNLEVRKYLQEIRPDIVVIAGSYFFYTNWIVIALKKKLHYPIYFWSETHFQEKRNYASWKLKIRECIRKFIYRKFDGFWYSGRLSKEMIEYYANKDVKYHFVPNLIDNQTYFSAVRKLRKNINELRIKWNIPKGNIVLITPARLAWVKGIHTFVRLLSKVEGAENTTMLVPGTGSDKEMIENTIKQSGLDVRLLGYQQQDVVMELYAMADFFVLPSLSDPNPLTCIEALWSGLPLLVSKHVGNYPEVIDSGKNGYVFDYDKPEEAIGIITKLLDTSSEWRQKAGERSLAIASKYYDPEKVVKRLIDDLIKENS